MTGPLWQPTAAFLLDYWQQLPGPTVLAPVANAGGAGAVDVWTQFTRTATTTGGIPDTHAWTVVSGPANAEVANGATIGSAAALTFRPATAGAWTLRYTASNGAGSTSDDITLTVNASSTGGTGARVLAVVADRTSPAAGDQALVAHWVATSPFQVVAVRSDEETVWAGTYDVVWISDTADTTTLALKYKTTAKPMLMTQGFTFDDYSMLVDTGETGLVTGQTTADLTSNTPNGGLTSPINLFTVSAGSVVRSRFGKVPPNAKPLLTIHGEPHSDIAWSLEEKATYLDTSTIPARRLCFGLANSTTGNLASDGLTLLDSYITWLTSAPTPYVYGGVDTGGPVGSTLSRTAVDNSTSSITSRSWTIQSGPAGAGSTLSTSTALSWTPSTTGSYVLRYSATNSNGTGTWDVNVEVVAATANPSFRYYRFQPTLLRTPGTAVGIQISEFELRSGFAALSMAGATATGVGTNDSSPNELPPKTIDGNLSSKWLNFNKTVGYLQIDLGSVTQASNYRIATANDATDRDPVSWTVDGSLDASTWVSLDTQTSYGTPTEREVYSGVLTVTQPVQSGADNAAGVGTASVSGLVNERPSANATATGTAAVSGFGTQLGSLAPTGAGTASVSGPVTIQATDSAAGVGVGAVTISTIVSGADNAAAVGTASVSGLVTEPPPTSAAGVGITSVSGLLTEAGALSATATGSARCSTGPGVAFVGGATSNDGQTAISSSYPVTIPMNALVGDTAVFAVVQNNAGRVFTAPTPPAGPAWTILAGPDSTVTPPGITTGVFVKDIVDGEPGSTVTFTSSTQGRGVGVMSVFSGTLASTVTFAHSNLTTAGTAHTSPTVTTAAASAGVATFWLLKETTVVGPPTLTVPAGQAADSVADTAYTTSLSTGQFTAQAMHLVTPGAAGTYGGDSSTSSIAAYDSVYTVALPLLVPVESGSLSAAGVGSGSVSGRESMASAVSAAGVSSADASTGLVTVKGSLAAAGVGSCGLALGTAASVDAAAVGAADVDGVDTVFAGPAAAGAGGAVVQNSPGESAVGVGVASVTGFVRTFANEGAVGVGTAAVAGFDVPVGTLTPLGRGTASVTGFEIRLATLLAAGVGTPNVSSDVVPSHIAGLSALANRTALSGLIQVLGGAGLAVQVLGGSVVSGPGGSAAVVEKLGGSATSSQRLADTTPLVEHMGGSAVAAQPLLGADIDDFISANTSPLANDGLRGAAVSAELVDSDLDDFIAGNSAVVVGAGNAALATDGIGNTLPDDEPFGQAVATQQFGGAALATQQVGGAALHDGDKTSNALIQTT